MIKWNGMNDIEIDIHTWDTNACSVCASSKLDIHDKNPVYTPLRTTKAILHLNQVNYCPSPCRHAVLSVELEIVDTDSEIYTLYLEVRVRLTVTVTV